MQRRCADPKCSWCAQRYDRELMDRLSWYAVAVVAFVASVIGFWSWA